ncbi:MAG TPA: hypothetical protein DIT25_00385 [Candidatus Moranbacteria bacterium]|nr:hypothetical protein [Candidatus Moranbacteria bacterium]
MNFRTRFGIVRSGIFLFSKNHFNLSLRAESRVLGTERGNLVAIIHKVIHYMRAKYEIASSLPVRGEPSSSQWQLMVVPC